MAHRTSGTLKHEAALAVTLTLAGALVGLGHLSAPLAWLGVVGMAAALAASRSVLGVALGLWAGAVLGLVLGHPWQADFVGYYLPWKHPGVVWGVTLATGLAMGASLKVPLLVLWLLGRRFALPVTLWLPVAWALGEAFLHAWSGVSYMGWLYSQWQVEPVLRGVGWLGWLPTLLVCLLMAAGAGEALARRRWKWLGAPACGLALLLLLPALPPGDAQALKGLGAVHFAHGGDAPRQVPADATLLVWPEAGWPQMLALSEGPGRGRRVKPPVPFAKAAHVLGAHTESPAGIANSLIALEASGAVRGARAKRLLFPFSERAVLGLRVPKMPLFAAGVASPVLEVAGRRVGTLICVEAFDRDLAAEARRGGAELLAISSSDVAMGASPVAARQLLAVAVLRAVETGLPVLRASRGGPAALVLANGQVVATSAPGSDGVLMVAGDHPALGAPAAPGSTVTAAVIVSKASPELSAALPAEACRFFTLEGFANPGVRARTVILAGHSEPPLYLGQPADRVAAAIASFRPELVVLDTCYGASTPLLEALAAQNLRPVIAAPPFRIPEDGFVYGAGFLAEADPMARAALVDTRPSFPILRWALDPAALHRVKARAAAARPGELRVRRTMGAVPLARLEMAPGEPVLVPATPSR